MRQAMFAGSRSSHQSADKSQSVQDGESGCLDRGDGDHCLVGDAGADILLGGAGARNWRNKKSVAARRREEGKWQLRIRM